MTIGKAKRAEYTLEFKLEAVRLVKAGHSMAAVAATLGVVEQTVCNWVKANREGKLAGAGAKPVSPEQMKLGRLLVEVARLKMERDVLKDSHADHVGGLLAAVKYQAPESKLDCGAKRRRISSASLLVASAPAPSPASLTWTD